MCLCRLCLEIEWYAEHLQSDRGVGRVRAWGEGHLAPGDLLVSAAADEVSKVFFIKWECLWFSLAELVKPVADAIRALFNLFLASCRIGARVAPGKRYPGMAHEADLYAGVEPGGGPPAEDVRGGRQPGDRRPVHSDASPMDFNTKLGGTVKGQK